MDQSPSGRCSGFSLLELLCAIVVIAILALAGVWVAGGGRGECSSEAERLVVALDRARALARVRQIPVWMVIERPRDHHGCWRFAPFKLEAPAADSPGVVVATRLERWMEMNAGVGFRDGDVDEACNPLEVEAWRVVSGREGEAAVGHVVGHVVGFNCHGRLEWPPGGAPLLLRMVERGRGNSGEERIWVGRGLSRTRRILP